MQGYLCLILSGHVPYVRSAGRAPVGEDLLHETIALSIVPTLNLLLDMRALGVRPAVALAYSPVLLEQLADSVVQKHFVVWMEAWLADRARALALHADQGATHAAYLARFDLDWGQEVLRSFTERYGRNLVAALRELCTDGGMEPLAGAATHAYLPLLGHPASLRAQLDVGALSVTRLLARRPHGVWLPECGFAPSFAQALLLGGADYFIADPSSVAHEHGASHLRPLWGIPRRLAVLVRDADAAAQAWSPDLGYPGDPLYRAPQPAADANLSIWRVGSGGPPEPYDPYDAFQRAREHAAHFAAWVAAELEAFKARHAEAGVAVVPLDAELLGRRWFEGPIWLRALLEALAGHEAVELITPSGYLRAHRPRRTATLREGSWGALGHGDWGGRAALPLWQAIGEVEERLTQLARRFPDAQGERERALGQALRELLLAQSSDWPLLAQAGDLAGLDRVAQHLERCEALCTMAEAAELTEADRDALEELAELDNPFPYLNYRVFAAP